MLSGRRCNLPHKSVDSNLRREFVSRISFCSFGKGHMLPPRDDGLRGGPLDEAWLLGIVMRMKHHLLQMR